jgi:phage tail sheath protein FI
VDQGTTWAVFEPNGSGLWARLRAVTESFLHGLFRRGAFRGASSREAYDVRCDASTTTAGDIANGIVNVGLGFAPLRRAEFVILRVGLAAARP